MAKSSSKPKTKRTIKTGFDEAFIAETPNVLDEDGVLKLFFTQNTRNIIAFLMPDLHAATDWSIKPEFCEQELINFLRGRLRQVDKRKVVDKLLKLRLLTGKDHFVFFHNEFQNALPDALPFRWFKSRMLIALKYNVENITTLITFTGEAPLKKHSDYDVNCFGTRTTFKPNTFVVIKQNEKRLIAANNPTALAFLAAKYAAQSKGDDAKRYKLKKKVFSLMEKQGFLTFEYQNIINFVFDFMLLPQKMEEQLEVEIPYFQKNKKYQNMGIVWTRNALMVMDAICFNETGMGFKDYAISKNAEIAAAKIDAEVAKEAAKEAVKEAAKATNLKAIHGMRKLDFSIEKIADVLELELDYVEELANTH